MSRTLVTRKATRINPEFYMEMKHRVPVASYAKRLRKVRGGVIFPWYDDTMFVNRAFTTGRDSRGRWRVRRRDKTGPRKGKMRVVWAGSVKQYAYVAVQVHTRALLQAVAEYRRLVNLGIRI